MSSATVRLWLVAYEHVDQPKSVWLKLRAQRKRAASAPLGRPFSRAKIGAVVGSTLEERKIAD